MDPLPIDVLERDWQRELHRPVLRSRFRAWRSTEAALTRFDDVPALLRFLRGAGSGAGSASEPTPSSAGRERSRPTSCSTRSEERSQRWQRRGADPRHRCSRRSWRRLLAASQTLTACSPER
jgi:hypothetical protein